MNSENSHFKVEPGPINKSLIVPTSKSHANRLLILAALDKGPVTVSNLPESTDVKTMLSCFEKIGLSIEDQGSSIQITNSFPECESYNQQNVIELQTGDGGTTNRFLIPLLARGSKVYKIEPTGHMRNRPMEELVNPLKKLGASIDQNDKDWMKIQGPINPQNIDVDSKKSTQFATGIMLALADTDYYVSPTNLDGSKSYFEMTEYLIENFKNRTLKYNVPVDFSSSGYPIALGAVTGKAIIKNFSEIDHFQPDSKLIEILKKCGAEIETTPEGLSVVKPEGRLNSFECDGSVFPDLVPTLCFIAAYAKGTSTIENIESLRHKECDRIKGTLDILDQFGVQYQYNKNSYTLSIIGSEKKYDNQVDVIPEPDHRMVMVYYLFMRRNSGGNLGNSSHVAKSFPNFFEAMA